MKTSLEHPGLPEDTLTDGAPGSGKGSQDVVAPHLYVVLECARLDAGGAGHSLANIDRVTLGRHVARSSERLYAEGVRTLAIQIPDRRMSERHACLVREEGRFSVEDLGSRNGTRINGKKVAGRVPLVDGDILEAGHTLLLFRAAAVTPTDAPADCDSAASDPARALTTLDAMTARGVDRLERVARSAVPVLVSGETGTGKELIARAIHRLSCRTGAFVAVNCGALPATLVEAQLFGHVRGAFSGAVSDAPGLLRSADGGTLFLDEIGDLPAASQAALLRVLQENEVVPVGGVRAVRVDLRVISATHRALDDLVARGDFRSDLYARLAGFAFRLPPLRDRRQDLGIFVAALVGKRARALRPDAGRALLRYDWPLNVRELRQALEAAIAVADGEAIAVGHLPDDVAGSASAPPIGADPLQGRLVASLTLHRGNVSKVARELGTARMQVQRWMRRFGIDPESFRR